MSGIENTLAPATAFALGRVPPHWYRTYVSLAYRLVTTCGTHGVVVLQHEDMHDFIKSANADHLLYINNQACRAHLVCWEVLHSKVLGESKLQGKTGSCEASDGNTTCATRPNLRDQRP